MDSVRSLEAQRMMEGHRVRGEEMIRLFDFFGPETAFRVN
jgi:hypothetical protein